MRRFLFLLSVLFFGLAGFLAWFVPRAWFLEGDGSVHSRALVVLPGWTEDQLANALERQGIVTSAWGYRLYSLFDREAASPRAGTYAFFPSTNYRFIAKTLARGPARDEITFTVIEGWTIRDIIRSLAEIGVDARPSDFLAERFVGDYAFLHGLPSGTSLEGYLFPDTYRVWRDQLPDGLIRKQLDEFDRRILREGGRAGWSGQALRSRVILASLVESEAKHDEDRALVAGIFENRLKSGMRLQSDATLNYVLRSGQTRLSARELDHDSPYNTYKYVGLPPWAHQ